MSRYSDVNQLLDEIGTSDRSAGDPWTISRSNQGTVKRDSFSPAVVGDLGAPAQALTSEIQSSEQIAKADEVVTSPTGSTASGSGKSSSSGILGGFLNLFPLASVVGKLFGLGGSASPPPLTPYIPPPSVNFQGAASGSLSNSTTSSLSGLGSTSQKPPVSASGFQSLSYGANGLPRSASQTNTEELNSLTSSSFGPEPALSADGSSHDSPDVMGQLSSLTSANFTSEPATDSPLSSPDLMAATSVPGSGLSESSASSSNTGMSLSGSSASAPGSQQGQSILVQVQAMDSQSFMDHSGDIAQAVRQAMLNLHSVNDVIADL